MVGENRSFFDRHTLRCPGSLDSVVVLLICVSTKLKSIVWRGDKSYLVVTGGHGLVDDVSHGLDLCFEQSLFLSCGFNHGLLLLLELNFLLQEIICILFCLNHVSEIIAHHSWLG